jgi:sec-independent protein translocase protein TatA
MNAILLFLGNLGMEEILLIGLFVLIFFGAKKVPEFMKGLGKGVREFKEGIKEVANKVEESSDTPEQNTPPPVALEKPKIEEID